MRLDTGTQRRREVAVTHCKKGTPSGWLCLRFRCQEPHSPISVLWRSDGLLPTGATERQKAVSGEPLAGVLFFTYSLVVGGVVVGIRRLFTAILRPLTVQDSTLCTSCSVFVFFFSSSCAGAQLLQLPFQILLQRRRRGLMYFPVMYMYVDQCNGDRRGFLKAEKSFLFPLSPTPTLHTPLSFQYRFI